MQKMTQFPQNDLNLFQTLICSIPQLSSFNRIFLKIYFEYNSPFEKSKDQLICDLNIVQDMIIDDIFKDKIDADITM